MSGSISEPWVSYCVVVVEREVVCARKVGYMVEK